MDPTQTPHAKKRRWLQFHLLTLVLMMFVASAIIWANLRPPHVIPGTAKAFPNAEDTIHKGMSCNYYLSGWPFASMGGMGTPAVKPQGMDVDSACQRELDEFCESRKSTCGEILPDNTFDRGAMPRNLLVGIGIVITAGVMTECLVRRRQAHNT
jgi:hypothetical protein